MYNPDSLIRKFTDMMSEGFIFIDNKGIIQIYNTKAKEIFCIEQNYDINHQAGKIENGDIVIIGDNSIGKDDGELSPEILKCMGIADHRIQLGDAIIAVGVYNSNKSIKPVYNIAKPDHTLSTLELNCIYDGLNISGCIDFKNKNIRLSVNGEDYIVDYINYIGHIVIIDSKNKKMKFYQKHGYTAKGESICDLLKGRRYRAKGEVAENFDVIGKNIFEIHKGGNTVKEFLAAASGKDICYSSEFKEINGKPTICTLLPVNKDNKRVGAVLKIDDISEIKKVIRERDEALNYLNQIERKLIEEENVSFLIPEIIGESSEITFVKKLAIKASKTNSTVLILGESGTGKSLLARAIHNNSMNKDKPFISVNCGSIPEMLLESEMFGYEGGAFTGARSKGKTGLFELAQGGTILLDEIGEISPSLQVKLLQVLQDRTFYKVGGNKVIEVNARIIAATNKNLEDEIIKGRFREDLYYRINVFPIRIPPLRERRQDILPLVKSILPNLCSKMGCEEKRISNEALQLLSTYDWPGNIRELENILERAINLTEGNSILSTHLAINKIDLDKSQSMEIKPLKDMIEEAERRAIEVAIRYHNGNKKEVMNSLKIGKTNFYEKIKKFNINI